MGPAFSLPYTLDRHVQPDDVQEFLQDYQEEDLWHYTPGRSHQGFEAIRSKQTIRYPEQMGKRLRDYAKELDD
jgi:hypothetical protein